MRARSCGRIIREGKVLLQRKVTERIWALPGGRVEHGETAEAALRREFIEELGWEVKVGRLLLSFENHFVHDGINIQQTEWCFEASCEAADVGSRDATLEFRWFSPIELVPIDFRPLAFQQLLFQD